MLRALALLFALVIGVPAGAQAIAVPATPVVSPLPPHHADKPLSHRERAALAQQQEKTADIIRIALILTLMAFIPAIVISSTSFLRTVVVLSMIRHAFGMPETPPNQMIVALSLFLTAICMAPTLDTVNGQALSPFLDGRLSLQEAIGRGSAPLRDFMLRQVRDKDIKAVYDMSHKPLPKHAYEVSMMQLVPAFMLSELRVAFRIGFVIMLPFLLIDVVVSCILVSLGMLMVPPSTLSLPIKVLMFVLIDGWSLIMQGVIGSFR